MTGSDADPESNQWRVEESNFLQVIPGPDEDRPYRGGKLRLLSIELYQEGIILTVLAHSYSPNAHTGALDTLRQRPEFVRYVEAALAQARARPVYPRRAQFVPDEWIAISWHIENAVRDWFVPKPQVTDDRGNVYHPCSASYGGTMAYRGTVTLQPGVGLDTRALTVRFGDELFTMPIPARP